MKVLFLYSELMGYTENMINVLATEFDVDCYVVQWDQKKKTKHEIISKKFKVIDRSSLTKSSLLDLVLTMKPDLIYVSGWMDKTYLSVVREAKKSKILIVAGLDTPWKGSPKQYFASFFLRNFWKNSFDYFWVPGKPQKDYAKKLGFENKTISNLYAANTLLFHKAYINSKLEKEGNYPHVLLFVGRLAMIKGIDNLVESFIDAKKELNSDWKLIVVGNGPLILEIPESSGVECLGFLNQEEIAKLTMKAGAFCLPSLYEPWGVVIHEAAAAGLPLLLSKNCGAGDQFLEEGSNGLSFNPVGSLELTEGLKSIMGKDDLELIEMGSRSYDLSQKISPFSSAASLISVLDYRVTHLGHN